MTTKKELLKQIEELQKKADAMPDDDGVWFPEVGDSYHYVNDSGFISCNAWHSDIYDQHRLDFGNIYRTEEQALEARGRRFAEVRVLRRIAELNAEQGWTACFDGEQNNCCIGIRKTGELAWYSHRNGQSLPIEYYGSQETIETVMSEMEGDYRLMLGGNEQ